MGARWLRRALVFLLILGGAIASIGSGLLGRHEGPGEIAGAEIPPEIIWQREQRQQSARAALAVESERNILFGDFHTHTTLSMDAFMTSMDFAVGEGSHPQADACDFARYCSALDFWSINDHAEFLTPRRWEETVASIRECNARATDPDNPDTVAFLGWEWTQIGTTTNDHFGHKNVVVRGLADDEIPARPISANPTRATDLLDTLNFGARTAMALRFLGNSRVQDFALYAFQNATARPCPSGPHVTELPLDCMESTPDPARLFQKLHEWDRDMLVIPHGNSWGIYTPAGSAWHKQLQGEQHDPALQTLIEVYSGHGNIEQYRRWRGVLFEQDGTRSCPPPSKNYTPVCWRAGEIIRDRCLATGAGEPECSRRAATARDNYLSAPPLQGEATVPMATDQDWLDAGQCRDCFQPPWYHRPASSAQYALAISEFPEGEPARRFRFGFIGSSDVHTARPGTGYKEYDRFYMTDFQLPLGDRTARTDVPPPPAHSLSWDQVPAPSMFSDDDLVDDRMGAFYQTGGLVAVHAVGRQRDHIWEALERREVYATSGPRTLLWFDLLNSPGDTTVPMGGETRMTDNPHFRVRAVGSFEQVPGCPDFATRGLTPERLQHLCRGECYNPSEKRKAITRIEVVRIRPQAYPHEPVGPLIEDPWRVLPCAGEPTGCEVEFTDPEFGRGERDTLYYVRAIEEPSLAVNGALLDCEYDPSGACVKINPTPAGRSDDRLAPIEERAWSSPIFVDYGGR